MKFCYLVLCYIFLLKFNNIRGSRVKYKYDYSDTEANTYFSSDTYEHVNIILIIILKDTK